jgi:hypothetical protein
LGGKSSGLDAIVVLGGSFCPLHAGHLASLEYGKRQAEKEGMRVVAGYLACAHDGHVRGKFKGRGERSEYVFDETARLRMCNAAAGESDWLQPTPRTFGSARECGKAMVESGNFWPCRIVVVKGRDAPLLTTRVGKEKTETVSSTFVRREMQAGGARALKRLTAGGVLPLPVAVVLKELVPGLDGA